MKIGKHDLPMGALGAYGQRLETPVNPVMERRFVSKCGAIGGRAASRQVPEPAPEPEVAPPAPQDQSRMVQLKQAGIDRGIYYKVRKEQPELSHVDLLLRCNHRCLTRSWGGWRKQ